MKRAIILPLFVLSLTIAGCDLLGLGGTGNPENGDVPEEVTDWSIKSESGDILYFETMDEALSFAKDPENYRSIFCIKGGELFAAGALILVQNTNIPDESHRRSKTRLLGQRGLVVRNLA